MTVSLLDKVYATGRKYAEGFKETMKIVFDDLPAQVELPRDPEPEMKPGSYSRARS